MNRKVERVCGDVKDEGYDSWGDDGGDDGDVNVY